MAIQHGLQQCLTCSRTTRRKLFLPVGARCLQVIIVEKGQEFLGLSDLEICVSGSDASNAFLTGLKPTGSSFTDYPHVARKIKEEQGPGLDAVSREVSLWEARVRTRDPGRTVSCPWGCIAPGGRVGVPNGQSRKILRPRCTAGAGKVCTTLSAARA